jgi:hypothetical protein
MERDGTSNYDDVFLVFGRDLQSRPLELKYLQNSVSLLFYIFILSFEL